MKNYNNKFIDVLLFAMPIAAIYLIIKSKSIRKTQKILLIALGVFNTIIMFSLIIYILKG